MRLRETGLLAAREIREAIRSRWFLLTSICFIVLSFALSWLGLAGAERSGLSGFDRTTASVLNLVLLFVPLVGLTLGSLSTAGELEDGSLGLLLSQPITRLELYTGKFLGLLAALTFTVFVGFGVSGIAVGLSAGAKNISAFLKLITFTWLLAGATLALGTLLSVALKSRARVIGAAFTAWIVLVYVSDLGAIGLAIMRHLEPGQIFAITLLNPVQQARLLGTLALTDKIEFLGPVGMFGIDHFGLLGLKLFLCGALTLSALLPFWIGYRIFKKAVVT